MKKSSGNEALLEGENDPGSGAKKTREKVPRCPGVFTASFGVQLVEYLQGATLEDGSQLGSWCWDDFMLEYPDLIGPALDYFLEARTGDPACAGLAIGRRLPPESPYREKAREVILSAKSGDALLSAMNATKTGLLSLTEDADRLKALVTRTVENQRRMVLRSRGGPSAQVALQRLGYQGMGGGPREKARS